MNSRKNLGDHAVIAFLLAVSCLFAGCGKNNSPAEKDPPISVMPASQAGETFNEAPTEAALTTAASTESAAVPTKPLREICADKLYITGDSIASGYGLYGFIPKEHSLAKESTGFGNISKVTFDTDQGNMSLIKSVTKMQPPLLMISMGMNDLTRKDPEWFASEYEKLIGQIRVASPNTLIVAASITPIGAKTRFSSNENIRNYNDALREKIASLGLDGVYFFDAYSVLADEETGAIKGEYVAKDGIHLNQKTYDVLLNGLFDSLEATDIRDRLSAE